MKKELYMGLMGLESDTDAYQPTEEEERDFWVGFGHITFFVQQNTKHVFEIQIEDMSGCAGGLNEMVGLEWAIKNELGIELEQLKEGYTYTIQGLTAYFYPGDGWETDDDSEYDYEKLTYKIEPWRYLKQKLTNFWWQNIGWRFRK